MKFTCAEILIPYKVDLDYLTDKLDIGNITMTKEGREHKIAFKSSEYKHTIMNCTSILLHFLEPEENAKLFKDCNFLLNEDDIIEGELDTYDIELRVKEDADFINEIYNIAITFVHEDKSETILQLLPKIKTI